MNLNISNQYPKLIGAIGDQADVPAYIHQSIAAEARGLLGRVILEIATVNLNIVFLVFGGIEVNKNAVELDDERYYSHIACNCTRDNVWLTKTKMK